MADPGFPRRAVVVGGGRWARVVTRELLGVLPINTPLAIVTPSAAPVMRDWIEKEETARVHQGTVDVRRDLPPGAGSGAIAVVVNRPDQHHRAAADLLERGYRVLVEKPFVTELADARDLVRAARTKDCVLAAGLVFLAAKYFHDFRRNLNFELTATKSIEILWEDPAFEIRYGEAKRPSTEISVAMDVLPHVWAALQAVFGRDAPITFRLDAGDASAATVAGHVRDLPVDIHLSRAGAARRRLLTLTGLAGKASLDFAGDPVVATIGEAPAKLFPVRGAEGGPLARMLRGFLEFAQRRDDSIAWNHGLITGEAIEKHMELVCAVDQALQARFKT